MDCKKRKKKYSTDERIKRYKEIKSKANLKYQQSETYKNYKKEYWKQKIYKIMVNYIKKNTDDVVKNIINKNLSIKEIRCNFKKYYGTKIYNNYIKNHS